MKRYKIYKGFFIWGHGITGKRLYRIQALKDFGDVKEGDKGGFVESEYNLSQDGDCCIYNDGNVYGERNIMISKAHVNGHVRLIDNAKIIGDVHVTGNRTFKEFDRITTDMD